MTRIMQLKIVSDGTLHGTHVVDAETGKELPCRVVEWRIDIQKGHLAQATLEVVKVAVEIVGEGVVREVPLVEGGIVPPGVKLVL